MSKAQAIREAMRRARVLGKSYTVYENAQGECLILTRDRPKPKFYEFVTHVLADD